MGSHSFTREELYDLVWSEPMTKLGTRFGISGNGLKKACGRINVPVPERGYWAKLQAGHKVKKTPLPPGVAGPESVTIHPPSPRLAPPPPQTVPASVQGKIDAERRSGKLIAVPARLSNPHRIIAAWLDENRRKQQSARHDPWFRDWYAAIDKTDLDKRRLRILSALFKALEARGYKLINSEPRRHDVAIGLGDEKLEVKLEERVRQVRRPLTEGEKKNRGYGPAEKKWTQEKVPTGQLVLTIKEQAQYREGKEWCDAEHEPLERKLNDVIAEIAGLFEVVRLRRQREAEEQRRRWKLEEERRLAEMERKRETIRFRRLVSHSENWRAAADIRAFVTAVEGSAPASSDPETFAAWKVWALNHADRIDPLREDGLFDRRVSDYEVYSLRD